MATSTVLGISSAVFYFSSTLYALYALKSHQPINRRILLTLAILGICCNTLQIALNILEHPTITLHLDLFSIATLFGWMLAVLATSVLWRHPLEMLAVVSYTCSGLAIISSIYLTTPHTQQINLSTGVYIHISLSIMAYCMIALAMGQSSIIAIQNHQLRNKKMNQLITVLPPLQTMESLLFKLLTIGTFMLATAIITGLIYVDDFWAQHLLHKTILSLLSLGVFTLLLCGRYFLGWRGTTAIQCTWVGFIILMLGYFGSKLVLEVILKRG